MRGYYELFKSSFMTDEQMDKYSVKTFMAGIIPGILFMIRNVCKKLDIEGYENYIKCEKNKTGNDGRLQRRFF